MKSMISIQTATGGRQALLDTQIAWIDIWYLNISYLCMCLYCMKTPSNPNVNKYPSAEITRTQIIIALARNSLNVKKQNSCIFIQFNRIVKLQTALPERGLELRTATLKRDLKFFLWEHFFKKLIHIGHVPGSICPFNSCFSYPFRTTALIYWATSRYYWHSFSTNALIQVRDSLNIKFKAFSF